MGFYGDYHTLTASGKRHHQSDSTNVGSNIDTKLSWFNYAFNQASNSGLVVVKKIKMGLGSILRTVTIGDFC